MAEDDLVWRVQRYFKRLEVDKNLPRYPLESYNLYRIMSGGMGDFGNREPLKEVVRGRFIDAIAYAVQQPAFYAESCSADPNNCNNGYIERVKVCEPKYKGLLKAVREGK